MNLADIVISANGRDAGKRFVVIKIDDDYALIADGKGRRLESPKRKKVKHLKIETQADDILAEKLQSGEKITNNEIRRFLAGHAANQCSEGGLQNAKR